MFISFFFIFFFPFEVFQCTECKFVLVLKIFFFKGKSWISTGIYWNTRNKPKWPEFFSKWNRNTLNKISGVVTVLSYLPKLHYLTLAICLKRKATNIIKITLIGNFDSRYITSAGNHSKIDCVKHGSAWENKLIANVHYYWWLHQPIWTNWISLSMFKENILLYDSWKSRPGTTSLEHMNCNLVVSSTHE